MRKFHKSLLFVYLPLDNLDNCTFNIFSHNLDLRENISFVNAQKLFLREYMNCLTAPKLKARK